MRPQVVGAPGQELPDTSAGLRRRSPGREEEENEEEEYDGVQQEAPTDEEKRWGTWLAITALIDLFMSGAIIITSFSYAYADSGVSLWCMGIQAISHFLSSMLLVLRFCLENRMPSTDEASQAILLRKKRRRILVREQIVSVTMGLCMLISSAGLLFKAFRKMKFWHVWYKDQAARQAMDNNVQFAMEFLAWYGFAMYTVQAIFRFIAARKMRRDLVWHCFIASVVSLVFLMFLGLGASYQKEWSWKAEPIAAIMLAFVNIVEGIRIVISYLDDMDNRLHYNPRA